MSNVVPFRAGSNEMKAEMDDVTFTLQEIMDELAKQNELVEYVFIMRRPNGQVGFITDEGADDALRLVDEVKWALENDEYEG